MNSKKIPIAKNVPIKYYVWNNKKKNIFRKLQIIYRHWKIDLKSQLYDNPFDSHWKSNQNQYIFPGWILSKIHTPYSQISTTGVMLACLLVLRSTFVFMTAWMSEHVIQKIRRLRQVLWAWKLLNKTQIFASTYMTFLFVQARRITWGDLPLTLYISVLQCQHNDKNLDKKFRNHSQNMQSGSWFEVNLQKPWNNVLVDIRLGMNIVKSSIVPTS